MEQLGIQPILLLAQIINFGIIMFVLNKFLYKPIISFLEKRKKEIAEGLALTKKMKDEEEKLEVKQKKLMETTKKDAKELLENAKKEAREEAKAILTKAHEEAQDQLLKRKKELDSEYASKEKELRNQAVAIAGLMVQKLLSDVLTREQQHLIISKKLKELEHMKLTA